MCRKNEYRKSMSFAEIIYTTHTLTRTICLSNSIVICIYIEHLACDIGCWLMFTRNIHTYICQFYWMWPNCTNLRGIQIHSVVQRMSQGCLGVFCVWKKRCHLITSHTIKKKVPNVITIAAKIMPIKTHRMISIKNPYLTTVHICFLLFFFLFFCYFYIYIALYGFYDYVYIENHLICLFIWFLFFYFY